MHGFMSILLVVLVALFAIPLLLALFVVIYIFVVAPIQISGNAMAPLYRHGQYWMTNKLVYQQQSPDRYDIIVFKMPGNENILRVGRILGTPGDSITVHNNALYINEAKEEGSYLDANTITLSGQALNDTPLVVPKNEYIILVDNRMSGIDSRSFGSVTRTSIIGKLWFCYWNCL